MSLTICKRPCAWATVVITTLFGLFIARWLRLDEQSVVVIGAIALAAAWLAVRFILAFLNRPPDYPASQLRVSVVMPVYNEEPALIQRVLSALESQTRPAERIWIIDDGSRDLECFRIIERWAERHRGSGADIRTRRFEVNRGKRHAQAVAFRDDTDADVFVTLDSDTVPETHALEEIIKPFADESIYGVSALIVGSNWQRNLLTRVVDVEFVNQFLVGRAAMGAIGSVLVACGSLAAYRSIVCRDLLDEYLGETFLGAQVRNGDDRKLSQYALLRGKVVFRESAVAHAKLPESLPQLAGQRFRWSTSFYRGTVWMFLNMPPRRLSYWVSAAQAAIFVALLLLVVSAVTGLVGLDWALVLVCVYFWLLPLAYIRSLRYVTLARREMGAGDQLVNFLLSPVAMLLELLLLIPLRYLAVFGVRSRRWWTRDGDGQSRVTS